METFVSYEYRGSIIIGLFNKLFSPVSKRITYFINRKLRPSRGNTKLVLACKARNIKPELVCKHLMRNKEGKTIVVNRYRNVAANSLTAQYNTRRVNRLEGCWKNGRLPGGMLGIVSVPLSH